MAVLSRSNQLSVTPCHRGLVEPTSAAGPFPSLEVGELNHAAGAENSGPRQLARVTLATKSPASFTRPPRVVSSALAVAAAAKWHVCCGSTWPVARQSGLVLDPSNSHERSATMLWLGTPRRADLARKLTVWFK